MPSPVSRLILECAKNTNHRNRDICSSWSSWSWNKNRFDPGPPRFSFFSTTTCISPQRFLLLNFVKFPWTNHYSCSSNTSIGTPLSQHFSSRSDDLPSSGSLYMPKSSTISYVPFDEAEDANTKGGHQSFQARTVLRCASDPTFISIGSNT